MNGHYSDTGFTSGKKDKPTHMSEKGTNEQGIAQAKDARESIGHIRTRAEKLTAATHIVSDIMSEREPMKWRLREEAVALMSEIAVLGGEGAGSLIGVLDRIVARIHSVTSLLDVSRSARLMSEMNAKVLSGEYSALASALDALRASAVGVFQHSIDSARMLPLSSNISSPEQVSFSKGNPWSQGLPLEENSSASFPASPSSPLTSSPITRHPSPSSPSSPASSLPTHHSSPSSPAGRHSSLHSSPTATPSSVSRSIGQNTKKDIKPFQTLSEALRHVRGEMSDIKQEKMTAPVSVPVSPSPIAPHPVSSSSLSKPQPSLPAGQSSSRGSFTPVRVGLQNQFTNALRQSVNMSQRQEPRPAVSENLVLSSSERRIIIMDTARQKREINVRDVAEKIRGVSEKTIQRELLAMVAEGILAKKGEKRWSTYSIRG